MTGQVGGRRSLRVAPLEHRPPAVPILGESKAGHSPLIVYGNLKRTAAVVAKEIRSLDENADELHGRLRALLSLAREIAAGLERLIEVEEGYLPRPVCAVKDHQSFGLPGCELCGRTK